jgi:hypothetical protein
VFQIKRLPKINLVLILFFCAFGIIIAQTSTTCIGGVIVSDENKEEIPYVHIIIEDTSIGILSDENGKFELCNIPNKDFTLVFYHTAFEKHSYKVDVKNIRNVKILLKEKNYQTKEITVTGSSSSVLKEYIPGKIAIKQEDIQITPNLLGSPDIVRTLQLMPGIQSVNEGSSGIYVRGGSPGHNYIEVDDIELMNPSHLMGVYSVFNPLLVEKVDFFKGNAPIDQSSNKK